MSAKIGGKTANELDQFFTSPPIAEKCVSESIDILKALGYSFGDVLFLEPSAGDGAFTRAAGRFGKCAAFDIDPRGEAVSHNDFLSMNIPQKNNFAIGSKNNNLAELPDRKNVVVIGNPPFGKRSRLAVSFINKSFDYSDTAAFILPLMFQKFSAQSRILARAKLIMDIKLPKNSFLYNGDPYDVRCCWQVWTLKKTALPDLRIKFPPKTKHKYFEMWQYNNTRAAEKYFNRAAYQWDFAVPRQGYKNYALKETDPNKLDRRTQWIFFKAGSKEILNMLYKIDFEKLSRKNTSVPGFGKADVIEEFDRLFPDYEPKLSASTQTFRLGDPNPSLAGTLTLF